MSIPPLVTVPSSSCAASVTMSLQRVVGVTASPFTLDTQSFKWPGEKWMIQFDLPTITRRAVASEWIAFALTLKGKFGYFLMGDPSARVPLGIATGTPVVDGSGSTGNILLTRGWTPNVTGILKAGDYIQYGTDENARLHMVVVDANSNGSGNAALTIEPAIRVSPTDGTAVVVNDAKGVFRLLDNTWAWSVLPGPKYRISFQAEEVTNA